MKKISVTLFYLFLQLFVCLAHDHTEIERQHHINQSAMLLCIFRNATLAAFTREMAAAVDTIDEHGDMHGVEHKLLLKSH